MSRDDKIDFLAAILANGSPHTSQSQVLQAFQYFRSNLKEQFDKESAPYIGGGESSEGSRPDRGLAAGYPRSAYGAPDE